MYHSMIKSFFQFSAGSWISAAISFFTTPITTYLILPSEFGKASLYTLVLNLAMIGVLAGADQSFTRMFYETDQEKRPSLLWNAIIPPLFLCGGVTVFLVCCRFEVSRLLFGGIDQGLVVILLSFNLFISIFERFSVLVLRMKKRGLAFSALRIVWSLANSGGIVFFALTVEKSFLAVIFGVFVSNLCVFALSFLLELKFWVKRCPLSIPKIKEILGYGLPFIPASILYWLLSSMDKLALRSYTSFEEIGLYTAGQKIVIALSLMQVGFGMFWAPVAYEQYENKDSKIFFSRVAKTIAGGMFLVSFLSIACKDIIVLIFDNAYLPSAKIMPFMVFSPLALTVSQVTAMGINLKKRTYWHLFVTLISASVNFVGNLLLVPLYGAKGAAVSTGIAYIVFFYVGTFISRKVYPVSYSLVRFSIGTVTLFVVATVNTFSGSRTFELLSVTIGGVAVFLLYKSEMLKGIRALRDVILETISKKREEKE